jgi:hypothetical protein
MPCVCSAECCAVSPFVVSGYIKFPQPFSLKPVSPLNPKPIFPFSLRTRICRIISPSPAALVNFKALLAAFAKCLAWSVRLLLTSF